MANGAEASTPCDLSSRVPPCSTPTSLQRLTFDSSSPNGILLFREVSKVGLTGVLVAATWAWLVCLLPLLASSDAMARCWLRWPTEQAVLARHLCACSGFDHRLTETAASHHRSKARTAAACCKCVSLHRPLTKSDYIL